MNNYNNNKNNKIIRGPKLPKEWEKTISLGEFFFNSCSRFKDRIFQINASTHDFETYESVKLRSIRTALELQKRGLQPDDHILICSENSLDNIIPLFGALFLGARVSFLDPVLALRYCKYGIEMVKPKFIFASLKSVQLIEECILDHDEKPQLIVFGKESKYPDFSEFCLAKSKEEEDKFKPLEVHCRKTALVYFSSGTTGLPKGIELNHYGLINGNHPGILGNDSIFETILHFTTLYWITAMVCLIMACHSGGRRVIAAKYTPELLLKTIEKYKVTFIVTAPLFLQEVMDWKDFNSYDLSSVVYMLLGGTKVSVQQMLRIRHHFSYTQTVAAYGCTEAASALTWFNTTTDRDLCPEKLVSCGKANVETIFKVCNTETREPLDPDQEGEICFKSPFMMNGYLNHDCSSCFDNEGFLKTGDLGFYDKDHCFFITGRLKEMFKHKTWHVVPSFLEEILQEHPGVKEAAVIGIPHPTDGEQPAACIVLKDDSLTAEDIHEFLNKQVSDYHKLVGGIKFVQELPKTLSGKLQRGTVKEMFLNGSTSI